MANNTYQVPGVYVSQSGTSLNTSSTTSLNIALVADVVVTGTATDTFYNVPSNGASIGALSTPMVINSGSVTPVVTWLNGTVTITGTAGTSYTLSTSGSTTSISTVGATTTSTTITSVTGNGTTWTYSGSSNNITLIGQNVTVTSLTGTSSGFNGTFPLYSSTGNTFTVLNTTLSGNGATGLTSGSGTQYVGATGTVSVSYSHQFGGYGTFTSYTQMGNLFGPPVSGSTINSSVSLAAYLAFLNGAYSVSVLPVARVSSSGISTASDSDWVRAFTPVTAGSDITRLGNLVGVDVVNPLYGFTTNGVLQSSVSGNTVGSGINNYLNAMASYGTYQRAFLGIDGTSNQITSNNIQAFVSGFNNTRATVVYPGSVIFNPGINPANGNTNTTVAVPGYYLASAVAGVFVGQPNVATPVTNKVVNGFVSIPNQISLLDAQSSYLPYGVSVVRQKRDGNLWILQGLTTNVSTWLTQEISINAIGDQLAREIKNALDTSGVTGSPMTPSTISAAVGTVHSTLINLVSSGLIQSYNNLEYLVNPASPTTLNISFQYAPTYPINYLQVTFSLNTQTGQINYGNNPSNNTTY